MSSLRCEPGIEADGRRVPRFSETLLSAYEGGQKRPGPEYLHYLCATYQADPADLGFDGRCLCGTSHRPGPAGMGGLAANAVPAPRAVPAAAEGQTRCPPRLPAAAVAPGRERRPRGCRAVASGAGLGWPRRVSGLSVPRLRPQACRSPQLRRCLAARCLAARPGRALRRRGARWSGAWWSGVRRCGPAVSASAGRGVHLPECRVSPYRQGRSAARWLGVTSGAPGAGLPGAARCERRCPMRPGLMGPGLMGPGLMRPCLRGTGRAAVPGSVPPARLDPASSGLLLPVLRAQSYAEPGRQPVPAGVSPDPVPATGLPVQLACSVTMPAGTDSDEDDDALREMLLRQMAEPGRPGRRQVPRRGRPDPAADGRGSARRHGLGDHDRPVGAGHRRLRPPVHDRVAAAPAV